jgi:hypothetical protein
MAGTSGAANSVERIILPRAKAIRFWGDTFFSCRVACPAGPVPLTPVIPPRGIILDDVMKEYIVEALLRGNKIQAAGFSEFPDLRFYTEWKIRN